MNAVPAIPEEQRATAYPLVQEFMDAITRGYGPWSVATRSKMTERLVRGAERYGTSWCEVNLAQDIQEELLDALNYTAMMLKRRELVMNGQGSADDVMLGMMAEYLVGALKIAEDLTPFEGPSSNEWVREQQEARKTAPRLPSQEPPSQMGLFDAYDDLLDDAVRRSFD